jgi:pyruvate carboxylase subunit B
VVKDMKRKYIDIMDTTFRDGFQSVFGGRVLMEDFLPAISAAKEAGITHFEFGGGARFQSLFFYLQENAFEMMDKFRLEAGVDANLQTLSRGINTVMLDTGSRDLIDLHAKLFKKHGATTIRNFDALNDVGNLEYSASCIKRHGLKHEVVIAMMDLPPHCSNTGAHSVEFYEKILKNILNSSIEYDSICFKDASGTSSPNKVYQTIKMARKLLPDNTHIRLHTHETAGISVACYLAALEAGVDGIDVAASPVSGGTSQPDILTLLHATKNQPYDLGGLEVEKILKYEDVLKDQLKDYFIPPEAVQVSPLIPFSPMPGGALTANTQMMRDNNTLDKFNEVINAMSEVVELGGYGASVTPVSQFYWQQAYSNVVFGNWKQIAPGYGKMVLGYFGKTPSKPDAEIVKLASQKLGLEPTTANPLDIADADPYKSIEYCKEILKNEELEITDENIFIIASCDQKGVAFLKGKSELNIRKISQMENENTKGGDMSGNYTVVVNGEKFSVQVAEGDANIEVVQTAQKTDTQQIAKPQASGSTEINSSVPGNVWKILKNPGDEIEEGEKIMILEAMKMEIDIVAPQSGIISSINVNVNDAVADNQLLATMS